jgi:hypothetical protein
MMAAVSAARQVAADDGGRLERAAILQVPSRRLGLRSANFRQARIRPAARPAVQVVLALAMSDEHQLLHADLAFVCPDRRS